MAQGAKPSLRHLRLGDDSFRFPMISARQLREVMAANGVLIHTEVDSSQLFSWYDMQGVVSAFSNQLEPQCMLHLRSVEDASCLFEEQPESYVMVVSDSFDLPASLQPFSSHLIIAEDSAINPFILVQEVFLQMLRWENQLNYLTSADGSLDLLLNIGASIFDGFIFVADLDNNIIDYSNTVALPNEAYGHMMQDRHLASSKPFVQALLSNDHCALPGCATTAIDGYGNNCIVAPIRYEGSLFGFIVLFCSNRNTIPVELKNQFAHYCGYVLEKCRSQLQVGVRRDVPHFYFLSALLRGEALTRTAIESSMERFGIPPDARYKVVVMNPHESRIGIGVLSDSMRLLNNKKSLVVLFEDYVVAVLYDESYDGALSHLKTLDELRKVIYQPFGVVCGLSQVFDNILDVKYGFRQAVYALSSRDAVETERSMFNDESVLYGISFEMAFPYYVIRECSNDYGFRSFVLSGSPLKDIAEADLEDGTNNFQLLWLYLLHERNASEVGRRLYMHRNSVLYHVKQIEKRYDFNLDNWYIREKLVLDYRTMFLRLPDDVLAGLFHE